MGKLSCYDTGAGRCYDRGYYELVCYLEEHRGEYAHFILTGEA
jgi:hypothetical protein